MDKSKEYNKKIIELSKEIELYAEELNDVSYKRFDKKIVIMEYIVENLVILNSYQNKIINELLRQKEQCK